MSYVKYITPLKLDRVAIGVTAAGAGYGVVLTTNGVSFRGRGASVVAALNDMVSAIKTEKRASLRNPGKRYRVAASLR